jgi:hypothetical protein
VKTNKERNFSVKFGGIVIKINWSNYDSWRMASGQEAADELHDAVSSVIDEYRRTPEFFDDAVLWATSKGLDVSTHDTFEDEYLDSEECWEHCEKIVEFNNEREYEPDYDPRYEDRESRYWNA